MRTITLCIYILAFLLLNADTTKATSLIKSKSGASALVSSKSASKFQRLIDFLDARGYHIHFMGGYGRRPNVSLHPHGKALDINQVARNRVVKRYPRGTIEFARHIGLISGSSWRRNPDYGHFQDGGWAGHHHVAKHRRKSRVRTVDATN